MLSGNYYAVARWMVERLKTLQTAPLDPASPERRIRWIAALPDIDAVAEETHNAPALFVVPLGRSRIVRASEAASACTRVDQRWLVVAAVRDAHRANEADSLLVDAGWIIPAVVNALNGWRPVDPLAPDQRGPWGEMRWIEEYEPIFRPGRDLGAAALFGLVFEAPLYLR